MKKLLYLLTFWVLCQQVVAKQWCVTQDGGYYVFADNYYTYRWEGGTFDYLIHGEGVLSIFQGGTLVKRQSCKAYYGTIDNDDIIHLNDGSSYIGEVVENKFNGRGVYIKGNDLYIGMFVQSKPQGLLNLYRNGKLYYSGSWVAGNFDGEGTLYKPDGSVREGFWQNGTLVQTYCEVQTPNGKYVGYVRDGKPNGEGIMCYDSTTTYTGLWKVGLWDGEGTYSFPGGTIKGVWSDGVLNAYGEMTLSNSDRYEGYWENNLFDGIGLYTSVNGTYDGEWEAGLQNGDGIYVCDDFVYDGKWEQGWMNGIGRIYYVNGDIYDGDVVENELCGPGTYHFHSGNVYDGEFVDGKFNGLGHFYFADGNVYEGTFVNGEICGDGTLYLLDGNDTIVITACWEKSGKYPKEASILFPNGDLYEGELVDGRPTDNGTWSTREEREENFVQKLWGQIWGGVVKANDFYKEHQETINKVVVGISIALNVVCPIGARIINVAYMGYMGGRIVSAGVDVIETGGRDSIANKKLLMEVGIAFLPLGLKKLPARKLVAPLSVVARKGAQTSMMAIQRNKIFGKVVQVTRDKTGVMVQKVVTHTEHIVIKVESAFLRSKIAQCTIMKQLKEILAKEPIILSKKELNNLCTNPQYLRAYITTYTGDKKKFLEFFIRLAKGNTEQAKRILAVPEIRTYVDRSIRHSGEGGVHEWLMTKNFTDFLTNPKWGKDGPFLAMALTKFTQNTRGVIFKMGGSHFSKINSGTFHQGLSRVIEQCSSAEEVFVNVKHYVKGVLTPQSYEEFLEIFTKTFQS